MGGKTTHSTGLFADYIRHTGVLASSLVILVLACTFKGDAVLIAALLIKAFYGRQLALAENANGNISNKTEPQTPEEQYVPILPPYLQLSDWYNLKDLLFYIAMGVLSSQLFYHLLCGYLQFYYYVLQRDNPETWKCQSNRFLTPSNEFHEVVVGTINMTLAGSMSGFLACWVMNNNYSTFYFRIDQYGYPYFAFMLVFIFMWVEATAYYSHRMLHTPFLYKLIHKHHHRYHSPTPYSVIAMSPFELVIYQILFLIPVFTIPVYALVFIAVEVYVFYYGLLDHSGIKMEALWPWQPNSMFHDDHHKYFHCNFGFNMYLFDYLHGTLRMKDRVYGEDVFGGKGKAKEN